MKKNYKWILVVAAGLSGAALFYVGNQYKKNETQRINNELNAYKASLPNYADSTRIFMEKHGAEHDALQVKADSMYWLIDSLESEDVNPKVIELKKKERDVYLQPLIEMNGRLGNWSTQDLIVQEQLRQHLDSVKQNSSFLVNKRALDYSK